MTDNKTKFNKSVLDKAEKYIVEHPNARIVIEVQDGLITHYEMTQKEHTTKAEVLAILEGQEYNHLITK